MIVKVPAPFLIKDPVAPVTTLLAAPLIPKLKLPSPSRVRVFAPRLTTAAALVPSKVVPMFSAVVVLAFDQVWLELDARATVITPVPVPPEAVFPLMLTTPEVLVLLMPPEPIVKDLFPDWALVFAATVKLPVLRKVRDLAA